MLPTRREVVCGGVRRFFDIAGVYLIRLAVLASFPIGEAMRGRGHRLPLWERWREAPDEVSFV